MLINDVISIYTIFQEETLSFPYSTFALICLIISFLIAILVGVYRWKRLIEASYLPAFIGISPIMIKPGLPEQTLIFLVIIIFSAQVLGVLIGIRYR